MVEDRGGQRAWAERTSNNREFSKKLGVKE